MIELPGEACRFDDLSPGDFFMFRWNEPEFGLCVSFNNTKSAIVFSYSPQYQSRSWLAVGGVPFDVLISFPHAVLRTDLPSAVFDAVSDSSGIISTNGSVYIRAKANITHSVTFDLRTGEAVQLKQDAAAITYSDWRIGVLVDGKFEQIFHSRSQSRQ